MNTTSNFFVSCLFCLILTFLCGCSGGGGLVTETVPMLTPAERADVDKYITKHGTESLLYYMRDVRDQYRFGLVSSADAERVLRYVKYFVSQGADVNAGLRNLGGEIVVTPLQVAVTFENFAIADFLVSKGAAMPHELQ